MSNQGNSRSPTSWCCSNRGLLGESAVTLVELFQAAFLADFVLQALDQLRDVRIGPGHQLVSQRAAFGNQDRPRPAQQ